MFMKIGIVFLLSSVLWLPTEFRPQDSKKASTRKSVKIDRKKAAWSLSKMDNWVRKLKIETMESAPPQFAVVLSLCMPSPGWKLTVDKVDRQKDGRVLIQVSGQRPEGMVPAVMTETKVRVTLGRLEKGEYLLDVWGRNDKGKKHHRKGTALLHARGR